jgi:broad specificity phosphatase PhoE
MPVGRLELDDDALIEEEAVQEGVPPEPLAMPAAPSATVAPIVQGETGERSGGAAAGGDEQGSSAQASAAASTTTHVDVYENQRKNLMGSKGFSRENLYGYERGAWSDVEGMPTSKDDPLLVPEGWAWAPGSSWEHDDGWQYGGVKWPTSGEEWLPEENGRSTLVRRRRWYRAIAESDGMPRGLSMRATQAQEQLLTSVVQDGEKVVGTCEAGLVGKGDAATQGVVLLTDQRLIWTKADAEDIDAAADLSEATGPASAADAEPEPEPEPDPAAEESAGDSDRSRVVIEVIQAWGLPPTSSWEGADTYTGAPKLDPYASLELMDWHDQPRSRGQGRTQGRSGTNEPVWRNYIELGTGRSGAQITIEILDEVSIMTDTKIAVGEVRLRDLPVGEPRMLQLKPFDDTGGGADMQQDRRCSIMDGSGTPWPGGLDPSNAQQMKKAPGRGKLIPIIQLRRLDPDLTPAQCRMTLFLVRHGESEWNEAKANRRFDVMAKSYDHPLNIKGVRQALKVHHAWSSAARSSGSSLALGDTEGSVVQPADGAGQDDAEAEQEIDEEEAARVQQILAASRMYASPLSRAVQTAMLAFQNHPCLGERERGMALLCSAREVKNLGGFDTVGDATGEDIRKRAMEKLHEHLEGSEQLAQLENIKLDLEEVQTKWWTSVMDTNETLERRVKELLCRVRYDAQLQQTEETEDRGATGGTPCIQTAIVVAHSIIIKEIIRRCTQPGSPFAETELAAQLGAGKVTNGGVVALDLQFLDNLHSEGQRQPALIEAAQLLFGTEVERHGGAGAHEVEHSSIPLHSLVRLEEGWSGLMSTFTIKLKFLATPDGIGTEHGGHVDLEFNNRLERDKLFGQLKEACGVIQGQLLAASLGDEESEILREACESCRPPKGAGGPELAGVKGGDGGSVLVTMRRLIWIPDCTRSEEALKTGGSGLLAADGSVAAVLSVKLSSVSFIEPLEERSLSNPMGFSSPGLKVKLRGGGAEHVVILFADSPARDRVKTAVEQQKLELARKNPNAASGAEDILREGYLHKNSPSGMMWQQRWFVLRRSTLVYYNSGPKVPPQAVDGAEAAVQVASTAAATGASSLGNPKGEIDLRDIKAIWLINRDGGWHSETEFGIRLVDRVGRAPYELRASTPEEASEWIECIKDAMRVLGATTNDQLLPTLSEVRSSVEASATAAPAPAPAPPPPPPPAAPPAAAAPAAVAEGAEGASAGGTARPAAETTTAAAAAAADADGAVAEGVPPPLTAE